MQLKGCKFGIITSSSYQYTINRSLELGLYNQSRAHFNNIVQILKELKIDEVFDIGESKSFEIYDDVKLISNLEGIKVNQVTLSEFSNLPDKKIIFYFYYYAEGKALDYLEELNKVDHQIIYYSSDDELVYKGYLLNLLITGYKGLDISKLLMILSGHSYAKEFPFKKPCHFLPMFPNPKLRELFRKEGERKPIYDFFVNCHHHTQLMEDLVKKMPNRKILIFTNSAILDIFTEKIKNNPSNFNYLISGNANTGLDVIVRNIASCKYVLIPNTYYHVSEWYRQGHYIQSTLYTHKVLESVYADRLTIGDAYISQVERLNSLSQITFKRRSEFYASQGVDDEIERVVTYAQKESKVIADEIYKLIQEK